MPTVQYPLRVRVYGGRNTHAARELPISGGRETACEYFIDAEADNHWLPGTDPVTCRRCQRALERGDSLI